MTNHLAPADLESYVVGLHDAIDVAAIEAHLAACDDCLAGAAREARLDVALRAAGGELVACPGCHRALSADRCDACGAARRAGDFTIREVLVHNGHGRLYRAFGPDGCPVALKELAFVKPPTPDVVAAFEREAAYLGTLDHPAIPRFVASFGEGEGVHRRLYLAQEFVAGESLETALRTHRFSEAEVIDVARRVLEILVYLQGLSPMVLHRDLKPANLVRRADGSIALVDFGAAHTVGETVGSTVIGTFGYMPVEQLGGIVDATTDLYALGATLLHLLTRTEPWRLFERRRVDASNVSPGLRRFLDRLTAHDPADRFPSAADALRALDHPPRAVSRWRRAPRPWLGAAAAVSVLAAGAGTFSLVRRSSRDDPARPVPVAIAPPAPARPAWARPEPVPGSTWCEVAGDTVACTAASRYRSSREEARAEAEDAALEALVHQATVGASNLGPAEITRQQKLEAFDRGDRSVVSDVTTARATVARLARAGRGQAWQPAHDFWWEEYDAANGDGSEFLFFVHLETRRADAAAFEASYAPVEVSGTMLVPLLPSVGWLFDPGEDQAYLVRARPSGRLRLLGLRPDDIILVDRSLPPADLEAAMSEHLDVLVRRGPFYQTELRVNVRGGDAPACDPNDPLCGL